MPELLSSERRGGISIEGIFARFFHWEAAGSVVLLAATIIALIWANSHWAASYVAIAHTYVGVSFGDAVFRLSFRHWINDLLMAVFFFVVGLEIKRELVVGELSNPQKAVLPVMAALGGLLAPAGIYTALNAGGPGASGWGVPMATDIAFAIGILSLFGKRVPTGLKVFLVAVAIADDVGAVIVIAVFYTQTVRLLWVALSAVILALMAGALQLGIRRPIIYVPMALLVWAGITASYLHPTVAGVLVASIIPVRGAGDERPMGPMLEEYFHPTVAFLILPLFAVLNAGVTLQTGVTETLVRPVGLGILLGLVLGKQMGIMLLTWLPVKARWAALPEGVTWTQVYGAACVAGVGFTMSLFITDLAFRDDVLTADAKVAILIASLMAAGWGVMALHAGLPSKR